MPWTDERVAMLEMLWREGLSASKIAEQMGCTKNKIIGKLNRQGWQSKQTKGTGTQYVIVSENGCRWPYGDPGDPGFHFCNEPISSKYVYCAAHSAIAHQHRNDTDVPD